MCEKYYSLLWYILKHNIQTKTFCKQINIILLLKFSGYIQCGTLSVLTMDSIILSFKANVSPCFSLILFLSRHFMAYLHYDRTNFIDDLLQIVVETLLSGITKPFNNGVDNWQPVLKMQLIMREEQLRPTEKNWIIAKPEIMPQKIKAQLCSTTIPFFMQTACSLWFFLPQIRVTSIQNVISY